MSLVLASILLTAQLKPTVVQATATIYPEKLMAKVAPEAMGIGVAVWDANMTHADVPKLVKDAGFKMIRYPGGSYADLYQWKTHSAAKNLGFEATIMPGTDFDNFMAMSRKAGTTPLITVNYGSNPEGTGGAEPSYAAEWVRYANIEKKWGVKYWEIGNEVYGNGFYNGQGWEIDLHAGVLKNKSEQLKHPKLGPLEYGKNVNEFARAMKAVDPTVKIGAVLTCPGGWPDGVAPDWNTNVLKLCGQNVDFVVVHWYGEGKTPVEVLESTKQIPTITAKLKSLVSEYCRPGTQFWMTEGDGSGFNMRFPGALFAADFFAMWLKHGNTSVQWWNLHNGLAVQEDPNFDDQGLLSSGHTNRGVTQPPVNTPFPPYYGVQMFTHFAKTGDQFVESTSDRRNLVVHAVVSNGKKRVMLINRDPEMEMSVSLEGFGSREVERFRFARGMDKPRRDRVRVGARVSVPPYGILVLKE